MGLNDTLWLLCIFMQNSSSTQKATVLLAGGWLSLVLGSENQAKVGYSPTSSRVKFIYEI